jgi:hypothetical protein
LDQVLVGTSAIGLDRAQVLSDELSCIAMLACTSGAGRPPAKHDPRSAGQKNDRNPADRSREATHG